MSIRKLGVILASVCASLLIIPVAAGAKTLTRATSPTPVAGQSFNQIPISGMASN